MKALLTSLQQTHPRPRPPCWMHPSDPSGCLLIFGRICRTFRKAHGRYSSQKLMPRRGTANSSPGRSCSVRSPTVDQRKAPVGTNTLYLNSLQNGPAYYLRPPSPPPSSGGPLYTGPPQWTSLKPPLTSRASSNVRQALSQRGSGKRKDEVLGELSVIPLPYRITEGLPVIRAQSPIHFDNPLQEMVCERARLCALARDAIRAVPQFCE